MLSLILENHQTFRGQPDRKAAISTALVRWFWEDYGFPLGGIDCLSIREADGPGTPSERCQSIIEAVYYKVREVTMVNKPDLNTEKFNAN